MRDIVAQKRYDYGDLGFHDLVESKEILHEDGRHSTG